MPLKRQVISAAMLKGLDAGGQDPRLVAEGLLRAENAVFPRRGVIAKRHGFAKLTGTHTNVLAMAVHDDNPLLIRQDDKVGEYNSAADTNGTYADVGTNTLSFCDAFARTVAYDNGDILRACEAVIIGANSEIVVCSYYSTSNLSYYYGTFNRITGVASFTAATGSQLANRLRIVAPGNGSAYVIWSNDSNALKAAEITSAGAIQSAVTISVSPAPADTTAQMDACAFGDAGYRIAIAYVDTSGDITVLSWDPVANTEVDATITLTSVSSLCVTPVTEIDGTTNVAVFYVADSSLTVSSYDETMTEQNGSAASSASTPSDVVNIAAIQRSGVNSGTVYYTSLATSSRCIIHQAVFAVGTGSMSISAVLVFAYNACMVGAPTLDADGNQFLLASTQGKEPTTLWQEDPQKNYFVLKNIGTGSTAISSRAVGRVLDGLAIDQFSGFLPVCHAFIDPLNASSWIWPISRWYTQGNAGDTAGFDLLTVVKDSTIYPQVTPSDSSVLVSNSVPYEYDGLLCHEQGFLMYPDAPVIAEHSDAGSWGTTSGSIGFRLTYEWTDSYGNRHESAPSEVTSHSLTADKKLEVTANCLHLTLKDASNIKIIVYRTTLNGATYYRDKVLDNSNAALTVTASGTDLVTGAPAATDAVTANDELYVNGGQIENISPHAHRAACSYQNRYFYADRQRENLLIRYSQEYASELGLGLRQNDTMAFKVDPEGGRITALATMFEKLFIFKESRVYVTHGQGLDPLVVQGITYERPRMVSPAIGCIDQRSVGKIPQGLVFRGQDGIYILTQGEEIQFIGHAVRYLTDTYTIKNCTVIADKHVVVWGTTGPAIVYDYLYEQWSTFTGGYNEMSYAIEARGLLYAVDADGVPRVEDRSKYIDQNTPYQLVVETGHFGFAELQSYKRLYKTLLLLGKLSDHKLRVKYAYDFDPTWEDSQVFDAADFKSFAQTNYFGSGLDATYNDQAYMLEVFGSRQRVTAVRLHISDEDPTGEVSRQALEIIAIGFEIGIRRGLYKLGADRRV